MIAALLLAVSFSVPQSPVAAAIAFLRPDLSRIDTHLRVAAQTSRYAVIEYDDAIVEGSRGRGQLLAERFPFGWQLLDISIDNEPFPACTLQQHGILGSELWALRPALTSSLKTATAKRDCARAPGSMRDMGPAQDVANVRKQIAKLTGRWLVSPVHVVDGYAVAVMWGGGGREGFFKKSLAGWRYIGGGGGAADVGDLVAYGIPKSIAKRLLRDL